MKTRFFIGMAMVGLVLTIWTSAGWSEESAVTQQKAYYLKCIGGEIENYSGKVAFTTSRSKNLQEYGESAALRVAFLSKNRDVLVEEMTAQNIRLHGQAVHQYLLQRFNQVFDTAVAKSEP
jgi:hypothetical protein